MIMMPSVQLTDRLYNDSYLQGSFLVADICYTDTPDTLCVSCVSSRTDHSLDTRTQCDLHNSIQSTTSLTGWGSGAVCSLVLGGR